MISESREFEEIAASIKRALEPRKDVKIKPHARVRDGITGRLRDIDILIEVEVSGHSVKIGVECRRKKRPVDKPQIEAFVTKLRDCRIDKGVFVSSSGFSDESLIACEHYSIVCCHLKKVSELPWVHLLYTRMRRQTNFQFHGEVQLMTVGVLSDVPSMIEFPGGAPPPIPFKEIGKYIVSLQEAEVGHHRRQIIYEPATPLMAIVPGHSNVPIARIELDAEYDEFEVEPKIENWLYAREGKSPSAGITKVHFGDIGGKPLVLEITTTSDEEPSSSDQ